MSMYTIRWYLAYLHHLAIFPAQTSPAPGYGGRYGSDDVTGLDTAYRTLADHARMVTVTLADGAVPTDK